MFEEIMVNIIFSVWPKRLQINSQPKMKLWLEGAAGDVDFFKKCQTF